MDLTPDELLTTTRAVRRRLDLERDVDPSLVEECVRIAQQAPNGSNREGWHFIVVRDAELRGELARLYRLGGEEYLASDRAPRDPRLLSSARFLIERMADVPVQVVPCMEGRLEDATTARQSGFWGTIAPAAWSFMLAARSRGLGTSWTTFHLTREREAAELLGIPYELVTQAALIPLAHTVGDHFRPARRLPLDQILHSDRWPAEAA